MVFEEMLRPDRQAALRALGYGDAPADGQTLEKLETAAAQLEKAATPRWIYKPFVLLPGCSLQGAGLVLQGSSVQKHLAGCGGCLLLALTLGDGVERLVRAAEAADMPAAVLLDALASALVEQYADAAENTLRADMQRQGQYLTSRFSPGYGDLPIGHQREILHLLDAHRAIGLSVSPSGIMLPRKSITAVLGVADHPVTGHLASCGECALRAGCDRTRPCGNAGGKSE